MLTRLSSGKQWILVILSVLGMAAAGAYLGLRHESASSSGRQVQPVPPLIKQHTLPRAEVGALQDLRLVAAVELAYFNAKGRYADPGDLKKAGYLDPAWPRSDAGAYQVGCTLDEQARGFACYAEPVHSEATHYVVDSTQVVRHARGRRPDSSSPVF